MAYDRNNSGFKQLLSTKNLNIKWPTCSLVDDKGNFWLGSHEGIYYLKKNLFTLFPKESFPKLEEVYTISQLSNDEIVAGTNRGFVYAIREKDAVPVFDGQPVFPKAEVFSIYDDKENHVWFGSGYQGISVISKGKRRNFRVADGLNDNTNYSFLKDSKGQLWSVGDNGITKITVDRAVDTISFEKYHASIPNGMDFKLYNAIEGPDGTLWVGGAPGIFHFDGKKMSRYSFPQNISGDPYVHHLCKDDNGNVWIATTDYGILLCYFDDQHNLRIRKTFSLTDGLLTNTFLCTVLDNRGNLWAASYRGLSCLQLSADGPVRIRNYDYRDGFDLKNYNSLSLFKDRSGKIWVSSSTGVISFDPASLLSQQYSTRVYITSIELLNKNEVIPVYSMNREAEPMKLDADNNSLTVHFTALHYVNPAALRYYYRFGNTDSNWNEVTAGRNISFRQLNHGEYKLHLKASIGGNEYSPVTTFLFSIKPPFWKQHWFIVSALMLAAVLIFLLLLWREKAIREREAQKTELQKLKAISYQHQLEVEQVINYFATSMSDQRTVEDLLWDVSRNCISKLGFEDCVIYINDEKRNMLVQKAAWGPKTTEENKISNPIEIPVGKGIVGSVAANGKAEIINDTGLDSRYIVDDSRRNAEIAVPIVDNGKVIGVIDSESSQKHFYTARHLQILTTLSSLVGDKIVKMQSEQEARSREIQLITLNRDLATSQLTALRAQMNPHFIFNALNSIQQYILKGDVDQANKYLSKFSRLQREVLNNCDQNFISLEKEIQMLNLYLELEQLRFSENFEYRIAIEKEIDTSEIRIPPMILQPFVENAIWHGLMPKTGQRMVSIEFVLQSEDILHCSIRDNGIGRVAAGKLKEEKAYLHSNHKSKGLSLVYERLEILRKQYQQPFEVVISDLSDTGGEVQGTNVSLLLYIGSA